MLWCPEPSARNTREESCIVLYPLNVMKHREEAVKEEGALAYSSRAYPVLAGFLAGVRTVAMFF